jgi:hypothetical protein
MHTTVVREPKGAHRAEVAALQSQLAELRAQVAGQLAAPAQHLHLHGVTADDIAAILARNDNHQ